MKRLALLLLVLSACLPQGQEVQPDPEDQADLEYQADPEDPADAEDQFDPYLITLLIDNKSSYLIALGGVGLVFGSVLPGEQKCVLLPNNDAEQQLWFRVQATRVQHYTLPFYPRESSGWKWTITGLGSPNHRVGRADAANIIHWRQCRSGSPAPAP
ncbi:MAG: hypothetical protein AMS18_16690 [Gemmatimonas sp. SG8_17]|nr:MAG: hypothetical protein AMS18_16690 [Gemmatimonas sp. SG8_17]